MTDQAAEPTYALYASFAADPAGALPDEQRPQAAAEAQAALESTAAVLRGAYTVTGYRADADLLLWLVGPTADDVQNALIAFRRTALGRALRPVWSGIGVHREAEFAKSHTPAFMRGEPPCKYVSVYPYVRSLEWYLLPEDERSEMLREHGLMGRSRPEVRANTVSAFALGDYEWLLAFECDELEPIVDLMRHLRGAQARRHTREELPFHAGRRRPLAEIVADLP
jgi:hydrogen peroxide-dependent heme synthase